MSRYDEETLAALLKSAQRWREEDPGELGSYHDCPLCDLHRKARAIFSIFIVCDGCPIRDKTGKHGCEGSPYDSFFYAKDEDDAFDKAQVFARWLHDLYKEVK